MPRHELSKPLSHARLALYWVLTALLLTGSILLLIVHAFWAWPLVPLAILLGACIPMMQKPINLFLQRLRTAQSQAA